MFVIRRNKPIVTALLDLAIYIIHPCKESPVNNMFVIRRNKPIVTALLDLAIYIIHPHRNKSRLVAFSNQDDFGRFLLKDFKKLFYDY